LGWADLGRMDGTRNGRGPEIKLYDKSERHVPRGGRGPARRKRIKKGAKDH